MKALLLVLLLLLPTTLWAQGSHSKFVHTMIATNITLNGIDTAQSMYLFGKDPDRFHEANILLRPFQAKPEAFALVKVGTAVAVDWLLLRMDRKHPHSKTVKVASVILNLGTGFVVLSNSKFTRGN